VRARTLTAFVLAAAFTAAPPAAGAGVRAVAIVASAGVTSPPGTALNRYAARRWPAWHLPPGRLTPHGEVLAAAFGAYYRTFYARAGPLPQSGCPDAASVYVRADMRPAAQATAAALLSGLAPQCGIAVATSATSPDPLFDPLPALGKADPAQSAAAVTAAAGGNWDGIPATYRPAFARLDALLGCSDVDCPRIASLPSHVAIDGATGLAALHGPVDVAAEAVDELLGEYAGALPGESVGWGRLDLDTLAGLLQLRVLRQLVEDRNPYAARLTASSLAAAVAASLDQSVSGKRNAQTPALPPSRFVALVGGETALARLAGLLQLSWVAPGIQPDATLPGSALVFELHDADRRAGEKTPFVQAFFVTQPLLAMRRASAAPTFVAVARIALRIQGCPDVRCPLRTFDSAIRSAVDPAFVARF
jgi:4-phytase / acid phosphatase